jgi:D-aminopeptidase
MIFKEGNMGLTNAPFTIGKLIQGRKNLITDVPGVLVGHVTLQDSEINTGVTCIKPHGGNLFCDKVMAASYVFNGYGKTAGLVQINELGTIETPILLTNTLSVGTAITATVKYMMEQNPDIGGSAGTVNAVVGECNDGTLNDIRGLHVTESHVREAIDACTDIFDQGAVGAGTGMCCLGFKGGIGSASRVISIGDRQYTVGALVLANFGGRGRLMIDGRQVGRELAERDSAADKGSIIMIIATDAPLSERQLGRVAKRAGVGLSRTGSYMGNGSGDVAIAFTTANRVPHAAECAVLHYDMLADSYIDAIFDATAEAVEESIVSALWHADTTTGKNGVTVKGLRRAWEEQSI